MENSACSFICLCPWKNPSAVQTSELYTIILFCVKWKKGIDISCAHHNPVFSPKKDWSWTARETLRQQTPGLCALQTRHGADDFVKELRASGTFGNAWKQSAIVNEVPKLFEVIISNKVSVLQSPLYLLLRLVWFILHSIIYFAGVHLR